MAADRIFVLKFVELTRRDLRNADDERALAAMKSDMARRIMSAAAAAVYDMAPVS